MDDRMNSDLERGVPRVHPQKLPVLLRMLPNYLEMAPSRSGRPGGPLRFTLMTGRRTGTSFFDEDSCR